MRVDNRIQQIAKSCKKRTGYLFAGIYLLVSSSGARR